MLAESLIPREGCCSRFQGSDGQPTQFLYDAFDNIVLNLEKTVRHEFSLIHLAPDKLTCTHTDHLHVDPEAVS